VHHVNHPTEPIFVANKVERALFFSLPFSFCGRYIKIMITGEEHNKRRRGRKRKNGNKRNNRKKQNTKRTTTDSCNGRRTNSGDHTVQTKIKSKIKKKEDKVTVDGLPLAL
jgi:hypothetical protein